MTNVTNDSEDVPTQVHPFLFFKHLYGTWNEKNQIRELCVKKKES